MTVDYRYYTETYGGDMPEADFKRLSRQAARRVDRSVSGEVPERYGEFYQDAVCAVADILYEGEQGGALASASNDGVSETYQTDGRTQEQKIADAIENCLADTGLLCRWA